MKKHNWISGTLYCSVVCRCSGLSALWTSDASILFVGRSSPCHSVRFFWRPNNIDNQANRRPSISFAWPRTRFIGILTHFGSSAQAGYGYHGAAAAHSFAPAAPFTSSAPALPPAATPPPAMSVGSYRAAWPWLYPSAAPNTFGRYDGRGGSAASAYPDQMRSGGGTTTNAGAGIRDVLADRTNLECGSGSGGGGGSRSRSRSRSGSSSARKFRRTWAWGGSGGAGGGGNGSPGGGGSGTSTARHGGGGAEAGPTRFSDTANADHVAQLTSMGYPADRARAALRDAGGNLEQAVETLLTPNTQVKQQRRRRIANFFLALPTQGSGSIAVLYASKYCRACCF